MKPGSLVAPRCTKHQMIQKLGIDGGTKLLQYIINLPDKDQIYTVKEVNMRCKCGKCKIKEDIVIEELQIFSAPIAEYGLPENYYVELAPPDENIKSIVEDAQMNIHSTRSSAVLNM